MSETPSIMGSLLPKYCDAYNKWLMEALSMDGFLVFSATGPGEGGAMGSGMSADGGRAGREGISDSGYAGNFRIRF